MGSTADDWERVRLAALAKIARDRPTKMRFRWLKAASGGFFWRAGKRWFITELDRRHGRFLRRIASARREALARDQSPPRLLEFRDDFRDIAGWRRMGGIVYSLRIEEDAGETARLAIWMLGRCQNRAAIPVILAYRESDDATVRREMARALRRLGSWVELSQLANDPDPRVRQLALPIAPKPFQQRIEPLLPDRTTRTVTPAPEKATLFTRLPVGPGRPPKPVEVIRALLQRIRRLVHGN